MAPVIAEVSECFLVNLLLMRTEKVHGSGQTYTEADLGFIKGGLTQGTNLLGRGVQSTLLSMRSMLELGGLGACPPPGKF